jgi:hypothetical protein
MTRATEVAPYLERRLNREFHDEKPNTLKAPRTPGLQLERSEMVALRSNHRLVTGFRELPVNRPALVEDKAGSLP